ncbi:DUF5454 family protein [Mycoplasmoides pneumoniae]
MNNTKNKSDWQLFLEDYRFYHEKEFDWITYLNHCLNSYPDFDILKFIRKYGPECEKSFLSLQSKTKADVYGVFTKQIKAGSVNEVLAQKLVQLDALRTNYLIGALYSTNKTQKKLFKQSWKNAKKQGYTKQEWLMTLVGLPFEKGEYHKQLYAHSRQEILDLVEAVKKLYLRPEKDDKLEFADSSKVSESKSIKVTNAVTLPSDDLDKELFEFSGEGGDK